MPLVCSPLVLGAWWCSQPFPHSANTDATIGVFHLPTSVLIREGWRFLQMEVLKNIKVFPFFIRCYLFIFRERGREGEREGEKHWYEKHQSVAPWLGTKPSSQTRALTGNWTCNLVLCRTMLDEWSHASQGNAKVFLRKRRWWGYGFWGNK